MIDDLFPEPLIRVGADGTIEYLNRAARAFLGNGIAAGRHLEEMVDADGERLDQWLSERRRAPEMLPGRLSFARSDGLHSAVVEAGRIPGSDGSVLIRFREQEAPYRRIVALTQELEERRAAVARRDHLLKELESQTEQLGEWARQDRLTGLANRGHFDRVLEREWERARAAGRPLALALLDVDHFKRVNDRFGHAVGDDVLRAFGRLLAGQARRATDFVARYGGEEFAVLLVDTSLSQTLRAVNEIVEATRRMQLDGPEGPVCITVSAGVAFRVPRGLESRPLIEAADRALYRAKKSGRDQWLLDEGLPEVPDPVL